MAWFAADTTAHSCLSPVRQCWRQEIIELYIERLLKLRKAEYAASPSASVLLFTNLLAIHAPLEQLQYVAQAHLEQENDANLAQLNDSRLHVLRSWKQDTHYSLALMHADHVLEAAQNISRRERGRHFEAPHDAICVFLATLVFTITSSLCDGEPGEYTRLSNRAKRGISLLENFQVRISKVMRTLLLLLKDRMG